MSEFVTIQVGQCGNQIGSVFWPLVLKEHGLLYQNGDKKQQFKKIQEDALHSFFYSMPNKNLSSNSETKLSNLKARALLIDMEESVVQRFQSGPLRDLFDKACSLTNYPGSGNNWAVGYFTHGNEQRPVMEEMLRSAAEKCDRLHSFLLLFSLGGGTGSGLGSAILPILDQEFPKIDRIAACVHPGVNNDVVTSPYNIAFSMKKLVEYASCVFPLDNKAILDICDRLGAPAELKTWSPYKNINSVIVKMILNLTSGARFPGTLNLDINDITTNLVPFYRLNFLSSSLFPIMLPKATRVEILNRESEQVYRVCAKENQLLRIDPMKGSLFAATLLNRSKESLSKLRQNVERLNKRARFVKWARPGLKIGHCSFPADDHPNTFLLLTNTTSMTQLFEETLHNFNKLYLRKAHVHHYTNVDGFSTDDFTEARESMVDIISQYNRCSKEISIPRLKVV